ncbi:MAG: hypothetical protein Q8N76_03755 [Candidatus Omnitrophota bacterium]|nr:hypothetical protein [Candidatus Omnitrophota bacterium]
MKKIISLLIVITFISQNTVFGVTEIDRALRPALMAEKSHSYEEGITGNGSSYSFQRLKAALSLILIASSLQAQKPPSNVPFYPETQNPAYVMQFDNSSSNPTKPDKRLSTAKRLLLAGLVAGGSFYMANHNPRLRRVLLLDVAGYGSVPMIASLWRKNSKSKVFDIWLQGMTSGLVMYTGKQILVDNIDTPGMGLFAKSVHTFGVSMNRNLALGKPALNRFEIDIGPALIGVQRNDKGKVRPDIALLPGSLVVLLGNIFKGNQFDAITFLRTGAFSFRTKSSNTKDGAYARTNIITMIEFNSLSPYLRTSDYDNTVAAHEAMHTLQYSQNYFLGLWLDNKLDFKSIGLRMDRDFSWIFTSIPDLLRPGAAHNRRLTEKEPNAWYNYLYPSSPVISKSSLIPSILIPVGTMLILLDPFKRKSNSGAPVKETKPEEKLPRQDKNTSSSL